MFHKRSGRNTLLGILAVALGGLALGYASNRFLPPPDETGAKPVAPAPALERFPVDEQVAAGPRGERSAPAPGGQGGKRALLVGVTRYDHLAASSHLNGPANDVRLLRTTLVERYGFPAGNVVSLTEDAGPEFRPTRANIAREFKHLAEAAGVGDQVVILLAGHGDRQPESDPPDPVAPEPDGIDEIFLPADVRPWAGYPARVPNAIADKEIRDWLAAITAKKAYVWAVFDCCHSATMTRTPEVVRQLPPGLLVPADELARARARAARRASRPALEPGAKGRRLAPVAANDYLVATFACREYETTPEALQPADTPDARYHGLLTYSIVRGLEQSAASATPITYRELLQQVQVSYLARPQGAPTPTVEGAGQGRVVLGTERPARPRVTLSRVKGEYLVNVGDLHGVTPGSVLRVYSSAGRAEKPRVLGHARVERTRPLDAVVVPVEYDGTPKPADLPAAGLCEVVAIDYPVGRLRVGVEAGQPGADELRRRVAAALRAVPRADAGLFELAGDAGSAHLVVRRSADGAELVAASGTRPPIPLPALGDETFGGELAARLRAIHRARSLIAVGAWLEQERARRPDGPGVRIEVLRHRTPDDPGEVFDRPSDGWVFRPGDRVSFRVTNTSATKRLEVTLLVVDPEYRITLFHPLPNQVNKALEPGASFRTTTGTIDDLPPFGPESLVAIITAPTNPPVDYGLLVQPGVVPRGETLRSPVAQLLLRTMHGAGTRSGLTVTELDDQGARVLSWRTEPAAKR